MNFSFKNICSLIVCIFASISFLLGQTSSQTDLKWYDAREFTVEGKGWKDTALFYDRLPARAEKLVRPEVWRLSQNSAGISVRFVTDAETISVRWKLRSPNLALPNMTAIAVSGIDLYVKEKKAWFWAASGRAAQPSVNEQKIISNMTRRRREFLLYLPLYNGVDSVEIGIPTNAFASAAQSYPKNIKPIVVYGTSIVQGASASRAGLAYPSILSRKLNRPAINLGFSGNGKMEAEIAELLAEIDAAVFIIDCLPNLSNGAEVAERTPKLIEILRKRRPTTPIVLIENLKYPDVFIENRKNRIYREKNAALKQVYNRLVRTGVKKIYYISGDNLIGNDTEGTIDGVHPIDIGFFRMTSVIEQTLKRFIN